VLPLGFVPNKQIFSHQFSKNRQNDEETLFYEVIFFNY